MEAVRVSVADPKRKTFTACNSGGDGCCKKDSDKETCALVPVKNTPSGRFLNQIPEDILNNAALNEAIAVLPKNYNFEVHKCVWHIQKNNYQRVALQLPEGFQRYALVLSDILVRFGGCMDTVILADVTYGACCIDDFTAVLLDCHLIIHYGHSCLVPVTTTRVPALYVFVEISLPHAPLLTVMKQNFMGRRVALLATVQYVSLLHAIKTGLTEMDLYIPQIRPLSPGEVLGCTAPRLPAGTDALMFVADGRFHLEAAMIANPTIPAYRYDPFTKRVFEEKYDHALMLDTRRHAIETARPAQHFGVILGTLGRQGSPAVLADIIAKLHAAGKQTTVVLMSEVRPEQLAQFSTVQAWIQTSCPRLSIDWGYTFEVPLLTPYELNVMLQKTESFGMGSYRMDFYATGDMGSGPWTPGHHLRPPRKTNKPI